MTEPKPFQSATIEAVLGVFRSGRRYRRFLVADEVGLGKTVVAQQVIRNLMKWRSEPLTVFYVCSNLSIAAQNRRKLVEILPKEERDDAVCHVDRLTLLASAKEWPTHDKLRLYSLTPDTSIPMRQGRRRDGRQEERALIHALVKRTFPWVFTAFGQQVFRRQARRWWKNYHVPNAQEIAASASLQAAFKDSVRKEFELEEGRHLDAHPELRDLEALDLIAHLRNALAASAIEQLRPDLVIFDEFQRFQDLLEDPRDSAEQRVIGRLRGDEGDHPPALLLLSATPYRLYARRAEQARPTAHREEFFELLQFLYGGSRQADEARRDCEAAFAVFEAELRQGQPDSAAARAAKQKIEQLCRNVMARTERAARTGVATDEGTQRAPAPLQGNDLQVFKHAVESFNDAHRGYAVPYWNSIPLPMQTMGPQYVAWKTAAPVRSETVPKITEDMRDAYRRPASWPHPRLRALREMLPPEQTVTPWLPPSKAWWPLKGPWQTESRQPRKALVFSRFRAVPQAVAACLSFDLEAENLTRERTPYAKVSSVKLLTASEGRHALLALFHPSPPIVEATEPLEGIGLSPAQMRRVIERQLIEHLRLAKVRIDDRAPRLPLWKLLRRLESKNSGCGYVIPAWERLDERIRRSEEADRGLAQLLADWQSEESEPLARVHPRDFQGLVNYAQSAPGVVVGRSLYRHWRGAVSEEGFFHTLDAAWTGLRTYLDQRWFFLAFRRPGENYPEVIQRLILEGNLESVLDEHLWIIGRLGSLEGTELARELRDGLSVKSGLFFLRELGHLGDTTFALRCHVAMPFIEARAGRSDPTASDGHLKGTEDVGRIRSDELRRAFNTPFWPYVLATTSVGQEGLDFHVWCDRIVHWDLCRNPVDLEQREGRIQRYGGLAIRRAIAAEVGPTALASRQDGESPWAAIGRIADEQLADASGLAPWWVCKGGNISRFIFDVPTSEQRHWLQWVQQQRWLYRLALGLPNQEDVLEILAANPRLTPETVRAAAINLSPWFSKATRRR